MPVTLTVASKIRDYFMLTKFTLSFLVVYTCVISYLLVPTVTFNLLSILVLFVAGMCITGAANAINQSVEKDTDAVMRRTAKRPVASGRMSQREGLIFAYTLGTVGVLTVGFYFNWLAAGLSLFSLFLYSYIYTPLKKVNSIAVLVGAFPGALPCLIGWIAGTGMLNPFATLPGSSEGAVVTNAGGYVLFAIQFLWQFPHFWAIAWLAHKDYAKAGFKLLPGNTGPDRFSALQAIIYSVIMVPVGMLPYYYQVSGVLSFWILLFCNLWMVGVSVRLFIKMNANAARWVMFSAYFYLMVVFLSLLLDKI
ncbi:MAG: protoheme IX farnesyltransferase [Chitinophagaceae bacterium]|nr:protoheme IX farnesyltransferase [Chitinophagaceae bacterium]MCW5915234.1 protoheme IX farnesyltransferase [Chitinophagaceae bacterium]